MLDGRPHVAKLMLKQSLVWYHWFCLFIHFSLNKVIFSIFQVSRDRERCLTASVPHFTLCGILLESFFQQWDYYSCTCEKPRYSHGLFRAEMYSSLTSFL